MKYTRKNEIKNFLLAKATTDIRPELYGVNIKTIENEKKELVCTDGYRIHILSDQIVKMEDGIYYLDECQKIEMKYPDYEKIIPTYHDHDQIRLEEFEKKIELSEKDIIDNVLLVKIKDEFYNYKYIKDAIKFLKSTTSTSFCIKYTEQKKPILFEADYAKALIMPCNK